MEYVPLFWQRSIIKKYHLDNRILDDTMKKIYEKLMKHGYYDIAKSFAEKYGL
jgi:hypothetical protein